MAWLNKIITEQLSILLAMCLPYQPSSELFPVTTKVWIEAFTTALGLADKSLDEPRIRAAFKHCRATLKKWPAPADVIEHMPRRPEQKRVAYDPPVDREKGRIAFKACFDVIDGKITKEEAMERVK